MGLCFMSYQVNKEKCIGCGTCVALCPEATKLGDDGKAEIVNSEELEKCGGESICPVGAIEKATCSKSKRGHL